MADKLSCSTAYGIFPDQGLDLCLLHWQVDSYPLYHQGSPPFNLYLSTYLSIYHLYIYLFALWHWLGCLLNVEKKYFEQTFFFDSWSQKKSNQPFTIKYDVILCSCRHPLSDQGTFLLLKKSLLRYNSYKIKLIRCNSYHSVSLEYFHYPQRNPMPISSPFPFFHFPNPPNGNR